MIRFVMADDLSGAADSAVHFRRNGAVRVTIAPALPWGLEDWRDVVQVHDTESRNLEAGLAADIIRTAALSITASAGPPPLFKKVDSTLRGNVGEELMALALSLGFRGAVLAPALPAQGRTVEGGRLLVDGRPVSQSDLARDPRKPVRRDLVGEILGLPVHLVELAELRRGADFLAEVRRQVVVVDAVKDSDLDSLAGILARHPDLLAAGSAGLAQAIARLDRQAPNPRPDPATAVVVVAGSANPVVREQVSRLRSAHPAGVILLDVADQPVGEPASMVHELGVRAQAWFSSLPAHPALVATGGDTALACCRALGEEAMWTCGEIMPGVPWGTLERSGAVLVTKAGGFGGPDALVEIVERLMSSEPATA